MCPECYTICDVKLASNGEKGEGALVRTMTMLKRILTVLISCVLIMPASVAYADLIPRVNDFYEQHKSEMTFIGRYYVVNSEEEFLWIVRDPVEKSKGLNFINGDRIWISHTYLYEGELWGYTSWYKGFVRFNQLLELYDYVLFAEEHVDEFYPYAGNYSEINATRSFIAWPWPGADDFIFYFTKIKMKELKVQHVYKDIEGREWGFVEKLGVVDNFWICLSDPLNEEIPVFNPEPGPYYWVTFHKGILAAIAVSTIPENNTLILVVTSVLVIVLVAGTVVLIKRFWKPNKAKPEG